MSGQASRGAASIVFTWTIFFLKTRVKSLVIWCVSFAALIALMVAVFPSFGDSSSYEELLNSYPPELREAFGVDNAEQLGTAIGFLNAELFGLLLPLAIAFLPLGYVSNAISHAEERGYLELGLSLPVARWHLAVATALAGATALAIAIATIFVTGIATAEIVGVELAAADMAQSCFSLWPLASLFAVIGLLVACGSRRSTRAVGVATGALIGMYVLDVVATLASSMSWSSDLTIFHYYSNWLVDGIAWAEYLATIALCFLITLIAARLFERRDLAT